MQLNDDVRFIKGIGEQRAKALNKLGISTFYDLISYFPRTYDDRSALKKINELIVGESVCVSAVVADVPRLTHIRKGLDLVKLSAVDETGKLSITFFNQSYVKDNLHQGDAFVFYGKVGGTLLRPEMTNPVFEPENRNSTTGRIVPIYRLTAGISQLVIQKSVQHCLDICKGEIPDPLPEKVRKQWGLAQTEFAYDNVHFPLTYEALDIARRRLIFEEFFVLSCVLSQMRSGRERAVGPLVSIVDIQPFLDQLPFSLTNAQLRVIREVQTDMASGRSMARLVQGDVGSGKTMVAAASCYFAAKNGLQSALMAPTEILAEQHYKTLCQTLNPLGLSVGLLTGKRSAGKKALLNELENGTLDVIVGTQALLSGPVKYHNLGLVITDEQHRFGVAQRTMLSDKGNNPHVLVMSATPIPRTLALMLYGELDISVIDELPAGRLPVKTYAVNESMRPRIENFVRRLVSEGRQVYIICPMVEDPETGLEDMKSVKSYSEDLSNRVFPDLNIGFIYGKMKSADKEIMMSDFASGAYQILVSTTVIEVGVDVPNAALIIVENADRFGLSQLHQLRGRVGRGKHQSYCVLFEGSGGSVAKARLDVLCGTNDGFKIAEQDLQLRGPGDFFGSRQHGLPEMKIASLADNMDILKEAQAAAKQLILEDRNLSRPENQNLAVYVQEMISRSSGSVN